MTATRILIVDDEPRILATLRITLQARGFTVITASNGAAALDAAVDEPAPDLVVLDLGLPDIDGLTVLKRLRRHSNLPVIVLSARTDAADKISCLDAGADDYVTKPFAIEELLARVRAAIRRGAATSSVSTPAELIETAAFTVDLINKQATRHGQPIHLTPTEWAVLEMLVRNEGKLIAQKDILAAIWGPTYLNNTNYLRVYLAALRRKLETDPTRPQHLLTEAGMGYRFIRNQPPTL